MRQRLQTVGVIGLWIVAGVAAILGPFLPQLRFYNAMDIFIVALAVTGTLARVATRAHRSSAAVARSEVRRLGNIVETTAIVREAKHAKQGDRLADVRPISLIIEGRQVGVAVEDGTPINVAAVRAAMRDVSETAS